MTDLPWIEASLSSARPKAMSALLRYFRNLDTAEEAFQEACLRAIRTWPGNGPPRDATAWLILVGRNSGVDAVRRSARNTALPPEDQLSDTGDAEADMAERLDQSQYRDDILRLLFICCHPDLPANQQIALALRIVAGVPTPRIARAFLVGEAAMEQRITRAKARIGTAGTQFAPPDAAERQHRLTAVATMLYLIFNEGYSRGHADKDAAQFCDEAIRLARLLLGLFQADPEIMGLLALMLLQHARSATRLDADGNIVLLDDQDRSRWNRSMIAEGLALVDKAARHRQPGVYQIQAALAAIHARAPTPAQTNWREVTRLYTILEILQPNPVVTLNRAVAVSKVEGPEAALDLIEPLEKRLSGYFHFHGLRGGLLLQLGRCEEAREAFNRAIALANTPAEAAHIRMHLDRLEAEASASAARIANNKRLGVEAPRP